MISDEKDCEFVLNEMRKVYMLVTSYLHPGETNGIFARFPEFTESVPDE